jgi:hypothetical protein
MQAHAVYRFTIGDAQVTAGRNFLVDDTEFTRINREQIMYAFGQEDKSIIEAVQRKMGASDSWSLKPVLLGCYVGAACQIPLRGVKSLE